MLDQPGLQPPKPDACNGGAISSSGGGSMDPSGVMEPVRCLAVQEGAGFVAGEELFESCVR